jgi:ABC-type tungstate transport system permease subunit
VSELVAKRADGNESLEAISAIIELQSFGSMYKYGVKILNNVNIKYNYFYIVGDETEPTCTTATV